MTPDESRAGISVGDVLRGRYRLDSQIGRGGMASSIAPPISN
ncbi:MAG TPA: hypothetical protein VJT71_01980 [Pyrinomonadaceae bacterium]|nr:hypothetical protein [Pyrinomonadaceae bacterium]